MGKHFNAKYEAILETDFQVIGKGLKDGEIHPHREIVDVIHFYQPTFDLDGNLTGNYIKVSISKSMLIDIMEDINSIEKKRHKMEYNPLPF